MSENANAGAVNLLADDQVYKEWMDSWKLWPTAFELAIPRNCDERPMWEPPIFDYSWLIGEEYEKKREAMLEYTGGDVTRTTDIMDVDTEFELLYEYHGWIQSNVDSGDDAESRQFLEGLWKEVGKDKDDVFEEWEGFDGGIIYRRCEDGTYTVGCWTPGCQSDDSSAKNRDNISDSASNRSISPSHLSGSKTNNFAIDRPNHLLTEHNRISSPTDEAEEPGWLDSLDASASNQTITNPAEPHDTTPLAFRLMSLRNTGTTEEAEAVRKTSSEDDDLD